MMKKSIREKGYDYTIYDKNYREIDGGFYDNPFASVPHAINEILWDVIVNFEDCQVVSLEDFKEQIGKINTIKSRREGLSILEQLQKNSSKSKETIKSGKKQEWELE